MPRSGVPDLKAALIVLRQTLQAALGANGPAHRRRRRHAQRRRRADFDAAALRRRAVRPRRQEILLPQARLPVAEDIVSAGGAGRSALAAALDPDRAPAQR